LLRCIWLPLVCCVAVAQSAPPSFDVASVKPSAPSAGDQIYISLGRASNGTVTMANVTLNECVQWAYGLVSAIQVAGPVWINDRSIRFDITAKAPPDTPADQLRLMMRSLLAERFALKVHAEPRRIEHLELSVDKSGARLTPSAPGPPGRPEYSSGRLVYDHVPMHTLCVLLSRQLKNIVIDRTNLAGPFDIDLHWTPDDADVAGTDIYRAIRQQLGLDLERKNTPMDVYVIDHAVKTPVEN
jgi:uncharacterized protein (TIGR03435 family)